MKKYRCTICDYRWEAQDEPFECPKCHSANIESGTGGGSIGDAMKKFWWVIVAALAVAALAVFLLLPKNSTGVTVKANYDERSLTVKLSGKHAGEYQIVLNNGEQVFNTSEELTEHTFTNLIGEYTLDILYMGVGETPKLRSFDKVYTFDNPFEKNDKGDEGEGNSGGVVDYEKTIGRVSPYPEIRQTKPIPNRIAQGETYKVKVILGAQGCPEEECEFSMDKKTWQKSSTFSDLQPGSYTFYARSIAKPTYISESDCILEPPTLGCPKIDDLNALLQKASAQNSEADKAIEKLRSYIDDNTTVKGLESDNFTKATELFRELEDHQFKATDIECSGKKIMSITVIKIK